MFVFRYVFAAILWFKDVFQISSNNSGGPFQHLSTLKLNIYNRQPPQKFLVDMLGCFRKLVNG